MRGTENTKGAAELSECGERAVGSAAEDTAFFFDDTNSDSPTWTYHGNYGPTGDMPAGPIDPYTNSLGETGDWGIGAYPGAVAISGDGEFIAAGAWNSGHTFNLYRGLDRAFRMLPLDNPVDPVNVVAMSADGAWIAAGGSFDGEVRLWETAPAIMMETDVPITLDIPIDDSKLDLDEIRFTRHLVKTGRETTLKEVRSIWLFAGGVLFPPEYNPAADEDETVKEISHPLPEGVQNSVSEEKMKVPEFFASQISTIAALVLRVELVDETNGTALSDEARIFVHLKAANR